MSTATALATYKIIHFFGLFLLFTTVGAWAVHARNGGTKETNTSQRFIAMLHGFALFLVLLGGFGMLAKLGLAKTENWPGWIYAKLGVWGLFGAMPIFFNRFARRAAIFWIGMPVIGALAAAVVIFRVF